MFTFQRRSTAELRFRENKSHEACQTLATFCSSSHALSASRRMGRRRRGQARSRSSWRSRSSDCMLPPSTWTDATASLDTTLALPVSTEKGSCPAPNPPTPLPSPTPASSREVRRRKRRQIRRGPYDVMPGSLSSPSLGTSTHQVYEPFSSLSAVGKPTPSTHQVSSMLRQGPMKSCNILPHSRKTSHPQEARTVEKLSELMNLAVL